MVCTTQKLFRGITIPGFHITFNSCLFLSNYFVDIPDWEEGGSGRNQASEAQ